MVDQQINMIHVVLVVAIDIEEGIVTGVAPVTIETTTGKGGILQEGEEVDQELIHHTGDPEAIRELLVLTRVLRGLLKMTLNHQ